MREAQGRRHFVCLIKSYSGNHRTSTKFIINLISSTTEPNSLIRLRNSHSDFSLEKMKTLFFSVLIILSFSLMNLLFAMKTEVAVSKSIYWRNDQFKLRFSSEKNHWYGYNQLDESFQPRDISIRTSLRRATISRDIRRISYNCAIKSLETCFDNFFLLES